MNGMPEAVQKDLDKANALIQAIEAGKMAKASESIVPQNSDTPAETTETPPAAPESKQVPAESQKPKQLPAKDEETYQKRYETLSGKYKAEVPRLQAELRQKDAIIEQLKADALRAQQAQATHPDTAKRYVKPEEEEAFGEMANTAERIARDVSADQIKAAQGQVMAQVGPEIQSIKKRIFFDDLSKLVPGWEKINQDALYLSWLGEPDPMSGIVRQNLLDHAVNSMDAPRAALLFNGFLQTMNHATAPASAGQPPPPPSLASQVSPPSRSAPPASGATQKKIWTTSEIRKVSDDFAKGLYRARPAEFQELQKEIAQAVAEKRIRAA